MAGLIPEGSGGLADVVGRILDKGLVINADISVSVGGTELLGIKIRAALASFETAALYGLDFPTGTDFNAVGWRNIDRLNEINPNYTNQQEGELSIKDRTLIPSVENFNRTKYMMTDMSR